MEAEIIKPVVALVAWTLFMWLWMYATRIPAMQKVEGLDVNKLVGGTGANLDAILPPHIQWKAHNYNHLHEQPTIFYAVAIALALIDPQNATNVALAWGYVGFRVAHSLVQATVNKVAIRFALFTLATLCLIGLAANAVIVAFRLSGAA